MHCKIVIDQLRIKNYELRIANYYKKKT